MEVADRSSDLEHKWYLLWKRFCAAYIFHTTYTYISIYKLFLFQYIPYYFIDASYGKIISELHWRKVTNEMMKLSYHQQYLVKLKRCNFWRLNIASIFAVFWF